MHISRIRAQLNPALRREILRDTKTTTGWVHTVIHVIAKGNPHA